MRRHLRDLIALFLRKVSEAESLLREGLELEEPRRWRQAGVPRTGRVGEFRYSFHGSGCCFEFGELSVDYDYGDGGRIDGFDLWRLTIFGEQLEEFAFYISSGAIRRDFEASIASGAIRKSGGKYDNLYYLSESL